MQTGGKFHKRPVGYYIDKVSDTAFPRHCGKSHALERLRELKYGFREGTKEISEEELIEILTEV